mgnify:CR=1 FL=1
MSLDTDNNELESDEFPVTGLLLGKIFNNGQSLSEGALGGQAGMTNGGVAPPHEWH